MISPIASPNDALRAALDLPDGVDPRKHWDRLRAIGQLHPHTIRFILLPVEGTCITRALDLTDEPAYWKAEIAAEGRLARAKFMAWLLDDRLDEVIEPVPGGLVMYFSGESWKHIGVVTGDGRITSMWGTLPVYDHGIWEVPSRYGNRLRFFNKLQSGAGLRLILEYARADDGLARRQ